MLHGAANFVVSSDVTTASHANSLLSSPGSSVSAFFTPGSADPGPLASGLQSLQLVLVEIARMELEELHRRPMIMRQPGSQSRTWLDAALRPRGVSPVVATEFDNLESIKRSAAQGSCLTVLPEYVIRAETAAGTLRAIPVEGRPLWRTLKLVWAADGFFSPVARAFLEELAVEYPALARLDQRPVT